MGAALAVFVFGVKTIEAQQASGFLEQADSNRDGAVTDRKSVV